LNLTWWTQALLLDGELAGRAKTLRYRLLHVAARVVRHARRSILRVQRSWTLGGPARSSVHPAASPAAALLTPRDAVLCPAAGNPAWPACPRRSRSR
jgi:hypothetical protein